VDRARLFTGVEFAMNRAARQARDKQSGQGSLFDLMAQDAPPVSDGQLPPSEPWPESQQLAGEKELLGIYLSGHPLSQFTAYLERYQLTNVQGLAQLAGGTVTRLGGLIATYTQRITKKKEPMAVLRLEDLDGSIEVIVYPEAYREYAGVLGPDQPVLVCGEVKQEEEPKLIAAEVYPLTEAPNVFADRLSIHLPAAHTTPAILAQVKELVATHPGRTPVVLCIEFPGGEKVFLDTDNSYKVTASEPLVAALERVVGEDCVYVAVNPAACKKPRPARRKWVRNGEGADEG
jgi:DNA polymerase-3 subunit alpha